MNVNDNLGNAAVDTSNRSGKYKRPQYKLPSLDTVIDVKLLPLAWNTSFPPKSNKYCDLEDCELPYNFGCNLSCGHSYHYECFLSKFSGQCIYCHEYLTRGITENSKIFQDSLNSVNNSITENEDDDNENNLENTDVDENENVSYGARRASNDGEYCNIGTPSGDLHKQ
jgi:hypothetical protein